MSNYPHIPAVYMNGLDMMERIGGDFSKQLAVCYRLAGPLDKVHLRQVFSERFTAYERLYRLWNETRETEVVR